jgi:hypothetical protein
MLHESRNPVGLTLQDRHTSSRVHMALSSTISDAILGLTHGLI